MRNINSILATLFFLIASIFTTVGNSNIANAASKKSETANYEEATGLGPFTWGMTSAQIENEGKKNQKNDPGIKKTDKNITEYIQYIAVLKAIKVELEKKTIDEGKRGKNKTKDVKKETEMKIPIIRKLKLENDELYLIHVTIANENIKEAVEILEAKYGKTKPEDGDGSGYEKIYTWTQEKGTAMLKTSKDSNALLILMSPAIWQKIQQNK